MDQNTIIFRMGEETGIVIEKTKEQFEHSLFKEQYRQALGVINEIISAPSNDLYAPISNIIAFCGDRGEGKTSALMTIRNILKGESSFDDAKEFFPENDNHIEKDSFKVLNLVDPAFFDRQHNLLELLLGQMYADIVSEDKETRRGNNYKDIDYKYDIAKRNRLMQLFDEVRHSLAIINKPSDKSAYDNLEEIDELATGISLKEKLNELLLNYSEYFQKKRVLICIDDLDLNITDGYVMSEEIRKYLSSSQACIVLIAIKIEQMEDVVKSYLRKQIDKIVSDDEINDMANRYVIKIIPNSHRINMPKGLGLAQLPIAIQDRSSTSRYDFVKEAVVRLIYLKTRFIFVNGRNISPIVPANLRSLRHLIALLWYMPDAKDDKNADNKENKEKFKNYFYHSWIKILDAKDKKFISELVNLEDISTINKYIIQKLKEIITRDGSFNDELLESILKDNNQIQNISTGDVFYVIRYVETTDTNAEITNLLFFIKAFYSIKLYETYDYISRDLESLFVFPNKCLKPDEQENIKDQDKHEQPSIYKFDTQLRQLNLLQRLLNGGYFTYKRGTLIPIEIGGVERDIRIINGTKLRDAFAQIVHRTTTREEKLVYLNICEFFALTTIRSYKTKDSQSLIFNRQQSGRAYFDNYNANRNYYVFDVLSIFYNVVNIQQTYSKWDKIFKSDFFAYAYNEPNSILRRILDSCKRAYNSPDSTLPSNIHHFISDSVIRFSELILSILDNALTARNIYSEGGNANNLKIFYDNILRIGITLYPLNPSDKNDKGYPLEFIFIKMISSFLDNIASAKEMLNNELKGEAVNIEHKERLLSQLFDDIYGIVNGEKNYNDQELNLDFIFRNSLARKRVKYPKTKDKVLEHLRYYERQLYNANTEFWLQIIDNKTYLSWTELREDLNQYFDDIVDMYKKIYKQPN